jgi:hypothetical protein
MPFLSEMKHLLDWTATPTVLNFYQFVKSEEVVSTLYEREVDIVADKALGRKPGEGGGGVTWVYAGLTFRRAAAFYN